MENCTFSISYLPFISRPPEAMPQRTYILGNDKGFSILIMDNCLDPGYILAKYGNTQHADHAILAACRDLGYSKA